MDGSEDRVGVQSRSAIVGVEVGDDIVIGRRPIVLAVKQCQGHAQLKAVSG